MNDTTRIPPQQAGLSPMIAGRATPLIELPRLARLVGVGRVLVKVEGARALGSFKALGGTLAGLRALARSVGAASVEGLLAGGPRAVPLPRLICASEGNHGLSVAAAARYAGTAATVYLPDDVNPVRVGRIEAMGARVIRVDGTFDDAVRDAAAAAACGEGVLIADTSDDPDDAVVGDVMAGYAHLARELAVQLREDADARPSHLFVQAGVGGLAAAMAEGLHEQLQGSGHVLVVEPERAACVARALRAKRPVRMDGGLDSVATMLSCGTASAPALAVLLRHRARSVQVDEDLLLSAVDTLADAGGPCTTASGAAGLAGLLHVAARPAMRRRHRLGADSVVLLVATEGVLVEP